MSQILRPFAGDTVVTLRFRRYRRISFRRIPAIEKPRCPDATGERRFSSCPHAACRIEPICRSIVPGGWAGSERLGITHIFSVAQCAIAQFSEYLRRMHT